MTTFSHFNNKELERTKTHLLNVLEKLVSRFEVLDEKISYDLLRLESVETLLKLSQNIAYLSQVLTSVSKIENYQNLDKN